MSSITLPSQSYRPAKPWGTTALRAMADAMSLPVALLRSTSAAIERGRHQSRQNQAIAALRAQALAHQDTNPSYAADLMAAANRHSRSTEQA